MRIVVLSGLSGSGKSTALRALEDAGFYAIDNLPLALLEKLVELLAGGQGETEKLAIVVDSRQPQNLVELPIALAKAAHNGHEVQVLFLDASDASLERRFSETRRLHPLAPDGSVQAGIARERELLEPVRELATRNLDTSQLSAHDLKREVQQWVSEGGRASELRVTILSFGFRHGLPSQADLVFDVRFIPNPFFVEALRPLSGKDKPCAAYVLERPETQTLLGHLLPFLEFLLPRYEHEGKAYLTIAIGCTGGQHRSVALAEHLGEYFREAGRQVRVRHRDMRVLQEKKDL